MKIEKECPVCAQIFLVYKTQKKNTCSKRCMGLLQTGNNNPNYGNKWSEKQRKIASERTKQIFVDDPSRREKISQQHKGKKLSEEHKNILSKKMKGNQRGRYFSDEIKQKIGIKSSAKFTDEYKARDRKTREERGYWIPLNQKSDLEIYYKAADWIQQMFNLVEGEQKDLLFNKGVFNVYSNRKGVVRDHKYSRRSGFENKVPPLLLRHPVNCQIITHSDNVKKKRSRYVDADSQTLEELLQKIISYNKEWIEQQKCLQLIKEYKNGSKWTREKGG